MLFQLLNFRINYISRHWEVENCLHWTKYREYEEDKHVLEEKSGKTWTILTNITMSLTNLLRRGERTLCEVREKCHADPRQTAKRLVHAEKLADGGP